MANMPPNPAKGKAGDGLVPTPEPIPTGTEGEITPEITPTSEGLPPEENYKKKFATSTRENQRILNENAKLLKEKEELEAKLAKADENASDEELSLKTLDWDLMTETEKAVVKRTEALEKKILVIEEEKAWKADFEKAKETFPKLAAKEEEFKEFCYKYPKSIEAETLAKAFLFEEPEKLPKEPRKGLEKPTGGLGKVPPIGMTIDDIKRLRETDGRTYLKMIREGTLKIPQE